MSGELLFSKMFSISFKNPSSLLAILVTLKSFNIPLTFKFVIISSLHSGIKDGRYILVFVTRSWYGTLNASAPGSSTDPVKKTV